KRRWWQFMRPAARTAGDVTVVSLSPDSEAGRMLLHAGYRDNSAVKVYLISRAVCALVLGTIPLILTMQGVLKPNAGILLLAILDLVGYLDPKLGVRMRARRRQHRLRLSLPDALDLLVVCVEAGMGLNQAIVRVSEELRETHPEIADEFRLVNLEIRAGRSRTEALRSMGERTGVDDIIALAAMIIQTEKFGTSIARSLRVHSDSLRV